MITRLQSLQKHLYELSHIMGMSLRGFQMKMRSRYHVLRILPIIHLYL